MSTTKSLLQIKRRSSIQNVPVYWKTGFEDVSISDYTIGNEDDPQVKYPNISTNSSHDDAVEIRYYWEHGIHGINKIGRLMGHDHVWVAKRLEVMGLNTIKHKHLSNAEQRKMHQKGKVAHRNGY